VRTGARRDQLDHLVERRPRALLGHHPAHLQRVPLGGQAERRIERCQPLGARRLVQLAIDLDRAEQGLELPRRSSYLRALDTIGTLDGNPPLTCGLRVVVRLQHRAQQLAALLGQHPLDLIVRRRHRVVVGEVVFEIAHQVARLAERAVVGDRACRRGAHRGADATRNRSIRTEAARSSSRIMRLRVDTIDSHPSSFLLTRAASQLCSVM